VISACIADDECEQAGKPLMSADHKRCIGDSTPRGMGINYYSLVSPQERWWSRSSRTSREFGTVFLTDTAIRTLFNLDTAKKLGITIPQSLIIPRR
jgi:hypothetical protein